MATQVRSWVQREGISPLERPDAIAIHGRGIIVDTSVPLSYGNQVYKQAPASLLWLDVADMTLGLMLLIMNAGIGAQATMASPVLNRYATSLRVKGQPLVTY
jgi:hypothetical protein